MHGRKDQLVHTEPAELEVLMREFSKDSIKKQTTFSQP